MNAPFRLGICSLLACALGLAVGSCGANRCGPGNCRTCCSPTGECVEAGANASATSCGTAGSICVDCSNAGTVCNANSLSCSTGTEPGACSGCVNASGICVPASLSATSVQNCGLDGVRCSSCQTGQRCGGGLCGMGTKTGKVGDACSLDSDCDGALQLTCRKTTSANTSAYPGGFCTKECQTPSAKGCPNGSACITGTEPYGERPVCWPTCGTPGDSCRNSKDYQCYSVGDLSACWLTPLPELPTTSKVGAACTVDTDCGPLNEYGDVCRLREDRTFSGGYCTRLSCTSDRVCGFGNMCLQRDSRPDLCVPKCPTPNTPANCRTGYVCTTYRLAQADAGLPDGGTGTVFVDSLDGYCFPPTAPAPLRTGQSCKLASDCQVPDGSVADCFSANLPDGGATAFVNGYCSLVGCASNTECGADDGGVCVATGTGAAACFQRCSTPQRGRGECAEAYVCAALGRADAGAGVAGRCMPSCANPTVVCDAGSSCQADGYCRP